MNRRMKPLLLIAGFTLFLSSCGNAGPEAGPKDTGYFDLNLYDVVATETAFPNHFAVVGKDELEEKEIIIPLDAHKDDINKWFDSNYHNHGMDYAPYSDLITGFNDCPNLEKITFKSYVEYRDDDRYDSIYHDLGAQEAIEISIDNAFNNCPKLKTIVFDNIEIDVTDIDETLKSSKYVFFAGKAFQNTGFTTIELPNYFSICQGRSYHTSGVEIEGILPADEFSYEQDDLNDTLAFKYNPITEIVANDITHLRLVNRCLSTIQKIELKEKGSNVSSRIDDADIGFNVFRFEKNNVHFNGNTPKLTSLKLAYITSRFSTDYVLYGICNGVTNIETFEIHNPKGYSEYYDTERFEFEHSFNDTAFNEKYLIEGGSDDSEYYPSYYNRPYKDCFNNSTCPETLKINKQYLSFDNCFNNIKTKYLSLNKTIEAKESFKNMSELVSYSGYMYEGSFTNHGDNVEEFILYGKKTRYELPAIEVTDALNVKRLEIHEAYLKFSEEVVLDKVEEITFVNSTGILSGSGSLRAKTCLPNLKELNFNNCDSIIYESIFWYENESLETINIFTEGTTDLANFFFSKSYGLKTINLEGTFVCNNYGRQFSYCSALEKVNLSGEIKNINEGMFIDCTSLKDVEFAKECKEIKGYAFMNCSSLEEATLNQLEEVPIQLFSQCTSIKTINLPAAKVINSGTNSSDNIAPFYNCTSLEHLYLSSNVTKINSYAVAGCSNLQYIEDGDFKYLGDKDNNKLVLYSCSNKDIVEANIPSTVRVIVDSVFRDCKSLVNVHNKEYKNALYDITYIGTYAFYRCTSLGPDLHFDNGDDKLTIDGYAFLDCSKLIGVNDCGFVNTAGSTAHSGAIIYLGNYALPDTLQYINLYNPDIVISKNCSLPKYTFINAFAKDIDLSNRSIIVISQYTENPEARSGWVIGDNVTIESSFFYNRDNVEELETTYQYVYYGSHLLKVEAPKREEYRLETYEVKNEIVDGAKSCPLYTVASYTFRELDYVRHLDLSKMFVKVIDSYTFTDMDSLEEVSLSHYVEEIKASAFDGCSSLETINYNGTIEEWNAINKNWQWNKNSSINVIHCSDGDINL